MNTKLYTPITLTLIIFGCISTSLLLSLSGNAEIKVKESQTEYDIPKTGKVEPTKDRVTFSCGETVNRASGENIPATVAYVPQRQITIPIIAWESNYIPVWDAQRRCETVSSKFQTFYEDGRLNYLTNGVNQGYPIICAVLEKGQLCKGEDQLFQVKPSSNPREILLSLNELLEGKTSQPLYQIGDKQVYVSIEDLLNNTSTVDEKNSGG
ncbi:COP23 domain-containing protein [Pleurocapsa sp. PCC 7319]|uniref:COP23 domain-containing protein n=1 Tax=Pleurocapsa sp. PCC 7319 TaxID=118161 RepID=UPI000349B799|nr:COP23 domain-containing protein [Pleurocapsa sp. PCC 7319]